MLQARSTHGHPPTRRSLPLSHIASEKERSWVYRTCGSVQNPIPEFPLYLAFLFADRLICRCYSHSNLIREATLQRVEQKHQTFTSDHYDSTVEIFWVFKRIYSIIRRHVFFTWATSRDIEGEHHGWCSAVFQDFKSVQWNCINLE